VCIMCHAEVEACVMNSTDVKVCIMSTAEVEDALIFRDAYFTELLQVNTLCSAENISVMLCVRCNRSLACVTVNQGYDDVPLSRSALYKLGCISLTSLNQ
jgi:hypothetical protein